MRRVLSIALLLLFMLPLVSPLFAASTPDANVPVCCRRNGKHHCMMTTASAQHSSGDTGKTEAASMQESCPYSPAVPLVVNLPFDPDEIQTTVSAVTISSSVRPTQTEVSLRVSIDRSHQKRGPPSLRLSRS